MHGRDLRGRVRAGLIGGALLTLTLAGHTAAGGLLDPFGAVLVLALALAFGLATVRARLRLPALLAVLAVGQVLLHLILTVAGSHAHGLTSTPALAGATTMLIAHGCATVIAAVAILGVDGLVERWLDLLRAVLGWALHLAPGPAAHKADDAFAYHPPTTPLVLRHGVSRRGPPPGRVPALA